MPGSRQPEGARTQRPSLCELYLMWLLAYCLLAHPEQPHSADISLPIATDPADRCAVCQLVHSVLLRRVAVTQHGKAAVAAAIDGACDDLRRPDASTTQEDGRKLQQLGDVCVLLLDSHSDAFEDALQQQDVDVCGQLERVCGAGKGKHARRRPKRIKASRTRDSSTGEALNKPPGAPPRTVHLPGATDMEGGKSSRRGDPPSTGGGTVGSGPKAQADSSLRSRQECELCGLLAHKLAKQQRRQLDNERTAATLPDGKHQKTTRFEAGQRLGLKMRLDALVEREAVLTACDEAATYPSALRDSDPTGGSFDWDECSQRAFEPLMRLKAVHADDLIEAVLQGENLEACTELLDGCTATCARTHATEIDQGVKRVVGIPPWEKQEL